MLFIKKRLFCQALYTQKRNEYEEDLKRSIYSIEDIIGQKVKYYRAPGFSLKKENYWVFDVLLKYGVEVDCSVFPTIRSHGGYPSFKYSKPVWVECTNGRIKEFPINLYGFKEKKIVFSGGGYFRLYPYSFLSFMINRSDYIMTYFHPRDFDPDQPVICELGWIRKFKSYYGLSGAFKKLERLLSDYVFIDLATAISEYDWELADVVKV